MHWRGNDAQYSLWKPCCECHYGPPYAWWVIRVANYTAWLYDVSLLSKLKNDVYKEEIRTSRKASQKIVMTCFPDYGFCFLLAHSFSWLMKLLLDSFFLTHGHSYVPHICRGTRINFHQFTLRFYGGFHACSLFFLSFSLAGNGASGFRLVSRWWSCESPSSPPHLCYPSPKSRNLILSQAQAGIAMRW